MDQLAAMRAFVRIVDTGNFTSAARALGTPKATITKHVQQLEAHLRTTLLNRTTRRVTVTTDGAAYYERVLRLLAELDELDNSMTPAQAQPKGRLRVDVSGTLAQHVILPVLDSFLDAYPEIQLDLGVSDRPADLIGENVDCVIRGGALTDQSLIARRIATIRMVLCAAPSYLERHGAPEHPGELERNHLMVGYFSAANGRARPLTFSKGSEQVEVAARYRLAVNEANTLLQAGLAGYGIFQTGELMARPHLEAGRLRAVMTAWDMPTLPLHVVYPPNRHLSGKTRVFVDWIAALFTGLGAARR